ncbi:lysine 2,3-aminomutase [Actinomadura sp. 7K507]|uniref:lysine 2,3-aminomutase n=1 Tax=Actinomadura sp. 7K507 TaxID=2530365 RepID=UPI001A9EB306|nr:lysine 2,3-aminomutase [Actinomadura sp. 7K507]
MADNLGRSPVPPRGGSRQFRLYTADDLEELAARAGLSADQRLAARAVAAVVPFAVTSYVVEQLIEWEKGAEDPIYRLTFPQPDMLPAERVSQLCDLLARQAPAEQVEKVAAAARRALAPEPAGRAMHAEAGREQVPAPVPDRAPVADEVVLSLPDHQYATGTGTYGTDQAVPPQPDGRPRWAATGPGLRELTAYVLEHPRVTSVVLSGGEPMAAGAPVLGQWLRPLLALEQIETIQLETAALARWPYRWITQPDADADDTLRLFETVAAVGKNLAVMARFCHPRELEPEPVRHAVRRIADSGAVLRTRAPLLASVNDSAQDWTTMWRRQLRLGMIPYLMSVERQAGHTERFSVPLGHACDLFQGSYARVSGLARTVRGPAMTTATAMVCVDGVTEIRGEKVFTLRFAHAADPDLLAQPFFARYDPDARWLTDLAAVPGMPFPHRAFVQDRHPPSPWRP